MKLRSSTPGAFTRMDMVIVIAAIPILVGFFLLLPYLARPHPRRHARINCVSNLKQVGLAFRMWANDNNDLFPFQVSTNQGGTMELTNATDAYHHCAAVSNELVSPKVLTCLNDTKRVRATSFAQFGSSNLSYFIGLDARETLPQTILSGDRNLLGGGTKNLRAWIGNRTPVTDAGWGKDIHKGQGNIGLADGSAQQTTEAALQKQIQQALQTTQAQVRFLIPP